MELGKSIFINVSLLKVEVFRNPSALKMGRKWCVCASVISRDAKYRSEGQSETGIWSCCGLDRGWPACMPSIMPSSCTHEVLHLIVCEFSDHDICLKELQIWFYIERIPI